MRKYLICILLFSLLLGAIQGAIADDLDPFNIHQAVSTSPSKLMIELNDIQIPCRPHEIRAPMDLLEVVEMALCNHPQTHEAWANVKAQAAQVGISESAYLPSANVTAKIDTGTNSLQETGYPQNSFGGLHTTTRDESFKMSWTLFDFGLRHANLESARYLLAAANATQDVTLQAVFQDATKAFYNLLSAQAVVDASSEAERSAQQSFMAASGKYQVGVGALADKLQAETTFAQATSDRVKAEGNLKNARGTLAVAMGMPANTAFTLDAGQSALPDTSFVLSIDALIEEAKRLHPGLIAARAQLQAAKMNVEAAKAAGLPSISLAVNFDHSDQLGQLPDGQYFPAADTYTRNKTVGVQVSIPLFEGLSRSYIVQSATAQVEAKLAVLMNEENQISLAVWTSYQSLITDTEYLTSTENLLHSATLSFNVAQGRYKSGVGTIIELLNAQSALASARQQRIQAVSNWRIARLNLAASLGKLGIWAIK
jgi:outer membrane protein